MAEQDDVLHLIDDTGAVPDDEPVRKWKIAVIDDDQAVHEGTRFALSDYSLNNQGLEILSAYSAAEGRELMRAHKDIAAVLLDVIMETDVAGLELVEYIRNEIQNFAATSSSSAWCRQGAGSKSSSMRRPRCTTSNRCSGWPKAC